MGVDDPSPPCSDMKVLTTSGTDEDEEDPDFFGFSVRDINRAEKKIANVKKKHKRDGLELGETNREKPSNISTKQSKSLEPPSTSSRQIPNILEKPDNIPNEDNPHKDIIDGFTILSFRTYEGLCGITIAQGIPEEEEGDFFGFSFKDFKKARKKFAHFVESNSNDVPRTNDCVSETMKEDSKILNEVNNNDKMEVDDPTPPSAGTEVILETYVSDQEKDFTGFSSRDFKRAQKKNANVKKTYNRIVLGIVACIGGTNRKKSWNIPKRRSKRLRTSNTPRR